MKSASELPSLNLCTIPFKTFCCPSPLILTPSIVVPTLVFSSSSVTSVLAWTKAYAHAQSLIRLDDSERLTLSSAFIGDTESVRCFLDTDLWSITKPPGMVSILFSSTDSDAAHHILQRVASFSRKGISCPVLTRSFSLRSRSVHDLLRDRLECAYFEAPVHLYIPGSTFHGNGGKFLS